MKRPKIVAAALVAVVFAILAAGNAFAASQTAPLSLSGSGTVKTLFHGEAFCDVCYPDTLGPSGSGTDFLGATLDLTAQTSWTAAAPIAVNYSQDNLKQGSTLDASDVLTEGAGTITVTYGASLTVGGFGDFGTGSGCPGSGCAAISGQSFTVSPSLSDSAPCAIPLSGESPRTCTHTTNFPIGSFTLIGVIKISVSIDVTTTFAVSGNGVVTLRKATISGGVPIADKSITFDGSSPSTKADPIFIDCAQPAGSHLNFSFTGNSYTATSANVTETGGLRLKVDIDIPLIPTFNVFDAVLFSVSAPTVQTGPISMTGLDQPLDLGAVLANTTPPSVGMGPIPQNGVEGSAIAFSVVGTGAGGAFSNCDPTGNSLDYSWSFDDGLPAFGRSISHVFADNNGTAPHSGKVVVTDKTGIETTLNFSVPVANVAPTVDAGPDKSSDWGLGVAFHANGSDAGAVDRQSLQFSWNFNDPASPVGAAGADVSHVFSQPGLYNVVVTVTDKDGATGTDTVQVTVKQRTTSIAYTGPTQAMPNDLVTLTAQVTDNHGQAVVGRTVTFVLGAKTVSGTTDGSGIASAQLRLDGGPPAVFTLTATFAGDTLYGNSTTSVSFMVGRNAKPPH